jgi:hypothetical protein
MIHEQPLLISEHSIESVTKAHEQLLLISERNLMD